MWFPIFRIFKFDSRTRIEATSAKTMRRIGRQLVAEKKSALMRAKELGAGANEEGRKAKDLLTLLIKANLSDGSGGDRQLSDEEVMNQIPTFLVAGGLSIRSFVSFCFFLTRHRP
jgi:cytochrome P450